MDIFSPQFKQKGWCNSNKFCIINSIILELGVKCKSYLNESKSGLKQILSDEPSFCEWICIFVFPFLNSEIEQGRKLIITEGSRINIYILLDTSGSIRKEDFELSKEATIALIRKACTISIWFGAE